MPRFLKPLIALSALAGLVLGGYALHGRTDWAVAGSPPVSPAMVWGACLLKGKPDALAGAKPGIEPRSNLYYGPLVNSNASGEKKHVGWAFYGHVERDGEHMDFRCESDLTGSTTRWLAP